jgi:transcription initiation factor TFIID subunit 12
MASTSSESSSSAIIAALGQSFKGPNGESLPNDKIAQMLTDNMGQLNDLAKVGKISLEQIQHVGFEHHIPRNIETSFSRICHRAA